MSISPTRSSGLPVCFLEGNFSSCSSLGILDKLQVFHRSSFSIVSVSNVRIWSTSSILLFYNVRGSGPRKPAARTPSMRKCCSAEPWWRRGRGLHEAALCEPLSRYNTKPRHTVLLTTLPSCAAQLAPITCSRRSRAVGLWRCPTLRPSTSLVGLTVQ